MSKRRFTREEIAAKAENHIDFGLGRRPRAHRRDIEWTDEDTAIYNEEYDKALLRKAKEHNG